MLAQMNVCFTRLSNVVLEDRGNWKVELKSISQEMMRCLSLDTEKVSQMICDHLNTLETYSRDNPEEP